ncbi:secretin and TonB N-terminal domain-containing protein [Variovorax sp. PAMC26660]|uniref:secretin and TonB N-terminal domain-containing protein n=1 Tax=Variovorax sp. PAMC26660 TaxID=2762322 RepID=UPI00164ED65F|nr:secretin and TonB N-terminal domain-containing protein [Variovorax sp. PAMC26660]QNK66576.1 TonB C-terminal domain-containing protein [Variovorax sp. PAMC26660]
MASSLAAPAVALALAGCMTLAALNVRAQTGVVAPRGDRTDERVRFDIARQPLTTALEQYGLATGLPVFFDAALVAGRNSTPVQASATPTEALHTLLQGTGLVADYTGTGSSAVFVLKPASNDVAQPTPRAMPDAAPAAPVHRSYDGLVQTRIWEAFCGNPRTAPGSYRTAMRFVIDGTGRIANAFLLHTSGDRARDGAILDTLRQIRIEQPPPPDMAQPLTMLILPRSQTPGLECPAARH